MLKVAQAEEPRWPALACGLSPPALWKGGRLTLGRLSRTLPV